MTAAVVTALLLGGCAGYDRPDAVTSPSPDATTSPPPPSPSPSPSSPAAEPTDDGEDQQPLPGEAYDGPPTHGAPATLAVVGVEADDVLNVRGGPGTGSAVVATLAPLARDVAATGRGRLLPGSIWLEVEVDGVTGWTNSRYLAHLGATRDITAELREDGPLPTAETLLQLARDVARLRASVDPASRIAVSDGPWVGDLGEVTVDVVGLGDDAVLAERLVIFAVEDGSGETWTVRTVEATELCGRGPGDDEGCP